MVVFLPFIGLYLAAKTAVGGVTGAFSRSAQDLGRDHHPGLGSRSRAHDRQGHRREGGRRGERSRTRGSTQLAKEVDEKRKA